MSIATRLAKLPSGHLKQLAKLTGINTTATKHTLSETLSAEIFQPARQNDVFGMHRNGESMRILSIDMGIRNLAFCVLEVKGRPQSAVTRDFPSLSSLQEEDIPHKILSILDSIEVIAWKRTSLYDLLASTENAPLSQQQSSETSQSEPATLKEAYDPATFASLTYNLVTRIFLPYNISHVLIERQRHRSGSAPAIMEWTVRVNMLESMLHAVFRTLRMEASTEDVGSAFTSTTSASQEDDINSKAIVSKNWNVPVPVVHSISPRKVGLFWDSIVPAIAKDRKESSRGTGKSKGASKIEKEAKIAVATSFLSPQKGLPLLNCTAEAQETADAFLAVRAKQASRKSGGTAFKESAINSNENHSSLQLVKKFGTKLDDLADCLLQGTAWVQWEWNRLFLRDWINLLAPPADKK